MKKDKPQSKIVQKGSGAGKIIEFPDSYTKGHINARNLQRLTSIKSLLMSVLCLVMIQTVSTFAQVAVAPSVGTGTAENPYQIASLDNLYWIAEDTIRWDKHFLQISDISAGATRGWFEGAGWVPVGNPDNQFTGRYNGNGYRIDSIYIRRTGLSGQDDQGLFGTIGNTGVVRNVLLTNVDISGRYAVGGVAGRNKGIIENSAATGVIYGLTWVGGLVGMNNEGTVSESYAGVSVTGYQNLGGLVGWNHYATVINSYSLGNVASDGGFAGGLVGRNTFASIFTSYSTGRVTGPHSVGGLVGFNNNIVSNSFWDIQSSGLAVSQGGTGYTTTQMKKLGYYPDWKFPDVWRIDETVLNPANNGYPSLYWQGFQHNPTPRVITIAASNVSSLGFTARWQTPDSTDGFFIDIGIDENFINLVPGFNNFELGNITSLVFDQVIPGTSVYYYRIRGRNQVGSGANSNTTVVSTGFSGGEGTTGNPYLISSLADLELLSETPQLWASHYRQTSSLAFTPSDFLAGGSFFNGGEGFIPIGSETRPFTGSYEGAGNTISGLFINRSNSDYQGLFGQIGPNGVVRNIGIVQATITGQQFVGGLSGKNSGNISGSFATGSATGTNFTGGLVGWSEGGVVSNSFANVATSGDSVVGGLIGKNINATVTNNYSRGFVTATTLAGGLIGVNNDRVENSFWDIETSGQTISSAGSGITTPLMKKSGTFVGWAFPAVWRIDESIINADNDGYPSLAWQGLSHNPTPVVVATRATNTTPTGFIANWNAATGATGYRIDVSDNPQFASFIEGYQDLDVGNVTSLAISGLAAQTPFHYFRVRGVNSLGSGANSNVIIVGIVFSGGDGSQANPYQISNLADLKFLSENPYYWDSHFIQTQDLEFTPELFEAGGTFYNDSTGFKPIGNITTYFTGSYNGQGNSISGLRIYRPAADYQALFGYLGRQAAIINLKLDDVRITGRHYIAGLAGKNTGKIEKTSVYGEVSGNFSIGGLVGMNHLGEIRQSLADVDVLGVEKSGGLVGWNHYSTISDSYATGSILGIENKNGGLVGRNSFSTILNSYSTGVVSGSTPTGGLIGLNESSIVQSSFWDKLTSERATSAAGTGKTTAELNDIGTFRGAGWLFTAVWHIDMSSQTADNKGYPSLAWQGLAHGHNLLATTTSSPAIYDVTAHLGGIISQTDSVQVTGVGVLFSQTNSIPILSGIGIAKYDALPNIGSFSLEVTGLQPVTDYYFRAFATTANDTAYGRVISFTTRNTQTITFDEIATQRYGNVDVTLSSVASSGLPVSYVSSDVSVATVSGSVLTIRGAGTVVITAIQAGNDRYAPALPVHRNLFVEKAPLTVTANAHLKVYGSNDPAFTVSYSGFVGDDDAADLQGLLAFERETGNNVGVYVLNPKGLTSADYLIEFRSGTLEIIPKQLLIGGTFTVINKPFDGNAAAVIDQNNLVLLGVVPPDQVSLTGVVVEFVQTAIGIGIPVRIVNANLEGNVAGNYTLSLVGAPEAFASITTAITEMASEKISVYPNPFTGIITFKNLPQGSKVTVMDLTGKHKIINTLVANQKLNLEFLPRGIYILSVDAPNSTTLTLKIIKE